MSASTASHPLNMATLRVTGTDQHLDELVARLSLSVSSQVRAGDRRGGAHLESHINVAIADTATPLTMLEQVRAFVRGCLAHEPGVFGAVSAELALGVSIGDQVQYACTVVLEPADVRELAALGIAVSFAAYPSSGDE